MIRSMNTTDWIPLTAPPGTKVEIPRGSRFDDVLQRTDLPAGFYNVAVLWMRLPVEPNPYFTVPQPALADGITDPEPIWLGVVTTDGKLVPIYLGGPELIYPR